MSEEIQPLESKGSYLEAIQVNKEESDPLINKSEDFLGRIDLQNLIIDNCKKLIRIDKIIEAFELLDNFMVKMKIKNDQMVVIRRNWNKVAKDYDSGVLSNEKHSIETNKIIYSFLTLLSQL